MSTDLMIMTDYELANLSWSAAIEHPQFVKAFEAATGETPLPKWICDLYAHRTQSKKPESRIRKTQKPRIREANSKGWIKCYNDFDPAIDCRKRKPTSEIRSKYAMPHPLNKMQYTRHAIHLMGSLLSIRKNASPFTLVLDDLNQRAMPFLTEVIVRGLSRNINVVVVSFEATRFHPAVRQVPAWGSRPAADIMKDLEQAMSDKKDSLVIVDSMYDAAYIKHIEIAALFDLVVMKFASNLVGVYHTDMLPPATADPYAPAPLDFLKFMATSVITCRSFAHALAIKAARQRAHPKPTFGLLSGAEGVVQCLDANDSRGIVLEAEFRRKSGRPETETFFLRRGRRTDFHEPLQGQVFGTLKEEFVILLDQQPAYKNETIIRWVDAAGKDAEAEMSFNLSLTEKQKAAREDVVLPYFDAQKQEGGQGGRILYDMCEEDDFDEEEDEI